ncbi:MAG: hypothetical protein JXA52_06110 [Planctomycetes bacterium]|nr:hypothetical protein [Planctomycetota bacterium]
MAESKIRFACKEDIPAIVELWNGVAGFEMVLESYLQLAEEEVMDYAELLDGMEVNHTFSYPTSAFFKSDEGFATFMEIMAMEL